LLSTEHLKVPISWASQQQLLAYYEYEQVAEENIWILPPDSTPFRMVASPFHERSPMFSPDGRWLAYVPNESGQNEVYLQPYPGSGSRLLISTDGGVEPTWSHDGRELYYRHEDQMMAVRLDERDGGPGAPRALFAGPYVVGTAGHGNPNYDVGPNGRFLMLQNAATPVAPRLHVVLNWFEELRAKVREP
jgi:hypothetical protein